MPRIAVPGLNEAKPWDGEPNILPPGEYAFQVEACTAITSSKGTAGLEFDLVVYDGADTDALNGAKKKHWIYYSDKSLSRLRNIADACGVAVNEGLDTDEFVGKTFIGEVFMDTYDKDDLATGGKIDEDQQQDPQGAAGLGRLV